MEGMVSRCTWNEIDDKLTAEQTTVRDAEVLYNCASDTLPQRRAHSTHLAVLDGFANREDDAVQRQLLARTNAIGASARE